MIEELKTLIRNNPMPAFICGTIIVLAFLLIADNMFANYMVATTPNKFFK